MGGEACCGRFCGSTSCYPFVLLLSLQLAQCQRLSLATRMSRLMVGALVHHRAGWRRAGRCAGVAPRDATRRKRARQPRRVKHVLCTCGKRMLRGRYVAHAGKSLRGAGKSRFAAASMTRTKLARSRATLQQSLLNAEACASQQKECDDRQMFGANQRSRIGRRCQRMAHRVGRALHAQLLLQTLRSTADGARSTRSGAMLDGQDRPRKQREAALCSNKAKASRKLLFGACGRGSACLNGDACSRCDKRHGRLLRQRAKA
eukprot:6209103-Pleurochrysis_carterae.AAC.1